MLNNLLKNPPEKNQEEILASGSQKCFKILVRVIIIMAASFTPILLNAYMGFRPYSPVKFLHPL